MQEEALGELHMENILNGRRKGKKKGNMYRKGDHGQLQMNKEEEAHDSKLCKLCNRENPLYFYQ